MEDGKRMSGYAVVSDLKVIKAEELPQGWSAQRAELWALIRALELSGDQRVNIYTDAWYAFATLHVHGTLYKKRRLLTAEEKRIKNQAKILKLPEAVWEPKEIAVIHCKGHQKGDDPVTKGNHSADAAARRAAWGQQPDKPKVSLAPEVPAVPRYSPEEEKWIREEGGTKAKTGWWVTRDHRVYVPVQLAYKLVHKQHELTHMGKTALETLLGQYYLIARLPALCSSVSQRCITCLQNDARQGPHTPAGAQHCGLSPFEDMEVDFTEVTP